MFKICKNYIFKTILNLQIKKDSGRGFRWDPAIIHWALTIQYHGGEKIIDILRGQAFQGQEKTGVLKVDRSKFALFLPSNSTLRKYLPPIDPEKQLTAKDVLK